MSTIKSAEEIEKYWDEALASISRGQSDGAFETASAFETVHEFLRPRWPSPPWPTQLPPSVADALQIVTAVRGEMELVHRFQREVVTLFDTMHADIVLRPKNTEADVVHYVKTLHHVFLSWYEPLRLLSLSDRRSFSRYTSLFKNLIMSHLTLDLAFGLKRLFRSHLEAPPDTPTALTSPVNADGGSTVDSISAKLDQLGLLSRFQAILFSIPEDLVDKRITDTCTRDWSERKFEGLIKWLREEVGPQLKSIYCTPGASSAQKKMAAEGGPVDSAIGKAEYSIFKALGRLRTSEIFDIIVDFPDSTPAIYDLSMSLNRTNLRDVVVDTLKAANARRLLHPGADTQDIISQYISMIKALRILDPPGVLLSRVADPVRQYLRRREDTIRCIVTSLVEPGHKLSIELTSAAPPDSRGPPEVGNFYDPHWTPDPVDAPPDFRSANQRDVVESLVSIYENRGGFVKELQVLLAQRLLLVKDFDVSAEIMNVETLKRRFGEAALQPCNVMLKDMADSKRTHATVRERIQDSRMHTIIASRLYWPNLPTSTFTLPPFIADLQKAFEAVYTAQKSDKRLRWLPQLGTVDLELELADRTVRVEATTLQASVIGAFASTDTWTTAELGQQLGINHETGAGLIRNALYFWANQGLVKQIAPGRWLLLEHRDAAGSGPARHVVMEEAPAPEESTRSAQIQKMRVFWAFIQGMLTNLGTLPLDRMHGSLNMLVKDFRGITKEELKAFLDAMQREGLVEPVGTASWRLVAQ